MTKLYINNVLTIDHWTWRLTIDDLLMVDDWLTVDDWLMVDDWLTVDDWLMVDDSQVHHALMIG